MKIFKKIALTSALALSTLVAIPFSETASAAQIDGWQSWQALCDEDPKCTMISLFGVRVNQEHFGGYSRLEIKSGAGNVSITPYGRLRANKAGNAVVYAYDVDDKYVIFYLTIQ